MRLVIRIRRFVGSLRCVLVGHRYGGLLMQRGVLFLRCVECGHLTDGIRVFVPGGESR